MTIMIIDLDRKKFFFDTDEIRLMSAQDSGDGFEQCQVIMAHPSGKFEKMYILRMSAEEFINQWEQLIVK